MPHDPDDRDQSAEELAWRAIVDNYGDRAELEDPPVEEEPPASSAPFGGRFGDPAVFAVAEPDEVPEVPDLDDESHFVPPPPPPLPRLAPDRAVAWAGVFGSPLVLLLALLVSISIPTWLGYLLIVAFVGGFVYLVLQMPREPRDPWDDGARV